MSAGIRPNGARAGAIGAAMAICSAAVLAQATLPPPPVSPAPVQRFEHDALGNRTLTASVVGGSDAGVSVSTYDPLARLTTRRDGAGGLTRWGYTPRGDVSEATDPLTLVTRYTRDGYGQSRLDQSPDAGATSRSFDAAGRVLTSLDARGVLSSYEYDVLGRPLQLSRSGSGFATQTFGWRYDETDSGTSFGVGRLTTSLFPFGSLRHAYDAQGRVVRESLQLALPALPQSVPPFAASTSYGYDSAGRLASITYPSGRTVRYLSSNGQVTAMTLTSADGQSTSTLVDQIQWEPTGEARSWRWAGVAGTPAHQIVRDLYGRIVRQPLGPYVRDIVYDERDRVASYTHRLASTAQAVPALDQSFGYDEADRLRSWSAAAGPVTVNYDANGNRTSYTAGGTTQWLGRFSGSNRQSIAPNPLRTVQYDAAGNVAADSSGLTLKHDASGRLESTLRSNSTLDGVHFHDGAGLRRAKVVHSSPTGQGLWTYFVHDAQGRLIAEFQPGSAPVTPWTDEYYWLGDVLLATLQQREATVMYFVHPDHLGAPRSLVDANGALRWTWFSDPFGYGLPGTPSGPAGVEFNIRLPGQYFDRESRLNHNWHRVYEPGSGRYVQSDPIGLAGGINTYAYVENQPTMQVDPLGLMGGGGGGSATYPNRNACPPQDCVDVIVTSHRGVCDNNPDPMCAAGMKAAGFEGPYFSYKTKVDVPCLIRFGAGVKGGLAGAGEAAKKYGPTIATRATNAMAGRTAAVYVSFASDAIAGFFSSTPVVVLSGAAGIAGIIEHCTCSRQ